MPLILCKNKECNHEWESEEQTGYICDWCNGTETVVLDKETPLSKMLKEETVKELLHRLSMM